MTPPHKTFEQREEGFEIYLMRHGIAADRDPGGSSDDGKRPLTLEGKLKLRGMAKGLDRLGVEWDWVITSPLLRAIETADVVTEEMGLDPPREICSALTPDDGSPQKLFSCFAQHPERTRVLLVGHSPSLGELASELLGGGHEANLVFKKGGCCLITYDGFPSAKAPGRLEWWLTPRLMRKLGG